MRSWMWENGCIRPVVCIRILIWWVNVYVYLGFTYTSHSKWLLFCFQTACMLCFIQASDILNFSLTLKKFHFRNFKERIRKQSKKDEVRWKMLVTRILRTKKIAGAPFLSSGVVSSLWQWRLVLMEHDCTSFVIKPVSLLYLLNLWWIRSRELLPVYDV